MKHFNYVRKPLGLENAAYEIIRKSKLRENDNADEDVSDREKCLKKRPMVNNNDEEEDLKLWPRKKSSVTFANELFIDEILDLNEGDGVSIGIVTKSGTFAHIWHGQAKIN